MRIGYWYWGGKGLPESGFLRMLRQLGVEDLVIGDISPPAEADALAAIDLLEFRVRCEDFGLSVPAVENLAPQYRFLEPAILGDAERERALASLRLTIESVGRAGIPYFGYYWLVPPKPRGDHGVIRTSYTTPGPSGARYWSFRDDVTSPLGLFRERAYSRDELWENHQRFLDALLPVAEQAGVTLSLHPDDPPLPEGLGGIPRLFSSLEGHIRAGEQAGDGPWGLTFCLGNWQLIGAETLYDAIEHFGASRRINYVHLQPVRRTQHGFRECEFDEADTDFLRVLHALRAVGFDGTVIPCHWPLYDGDDGHETRALAWSVGYTRGLFQAAGVGRRLLATAT